MKIPGASPDSPALSGLLRDQERFNLANPDLTSQHPRSALVPSPQRLWALPAHLRTLFSKERREGSRLILWRVPAGYQAPSMAAVLKLEPMERIQEPMNLGGKHWQVFSVFPLKPLPDI